MEGVSAEFFQLVKQAAAAAKAQREAAGLPPLPARSYRGVRQHYGKYGAEIRDPLDSERAWLGTYATPEEAAYAYDIAARVVQRNKARPNFADPPPMPADEDATETIVLSYFTEVRHARLSRAERRAAQAAAQARGEQQEHGAEEGESSDQAPRTDDANKTDDADADQE